MTDEILAIEMKNNVKAKELLPDGTYRQLHPRPDETAIDSQRWFMDHSRDH